MLAEEPKVWSVFSIASAFAITLGVGLFLYVMGNGRELVQSTAEAMCWVGAASILLSAPLALCGIVQENVKGRWIAKAVLVLFALIIAGFIRKLIWRR